MCDTQALQKDGKTFFAKNSDRETSEPQLVVRIPPVRNDNTPKIRTTYIEIDQVPNRFGVILSKPSWIWGAEMGANDQGVMIGNEAIWTKVQEKSLGLIGMDLLRLGLERGSSAKHALQIITKFLQKYGQGGICGYRDRKFSYDNSFLIADPKEAWILETANRHWVAKKVKGFAAISNCCTIGADFDLKSSGIEDFARKKRLFSGKGEFNFAKAFENKLFHTLIGSYKRLKEDIGSLKYLYSKSDLSIQDLMDNLRLHVHPHSKSIGELCDPCMHATDKLIRREQTCSSQVSELGEETSLHFFTGTSAPCLSIFKPVNFDFNLQFSVLNRDESTVINSLWQRHEYIHRHAILNSEQREKLIKSRCIEEARMLQFLKRARRKVSRKDFLKADRIVKDWENKWYKYFYGKKFSYPRNAFGRYWKSINLQDGFDM